MACSRNGFSCTGMFAPREWRRFMLQRAFLARFAAATPSESSRALPWRCLQPLRHHLQIERFLSDAHVVIQHDEQAAKHRPERNRNDARERAGKVLVAD